jgi:hypothetical protein
MKSILRSAFFLIGTGFVILLALIFIPESMVVIPMLVREKITYFALGIMTGGIVLLLGCAITWIRAHTSFDE